MGIVEYENVDQTHKIVVNEDLCKGCEGCAVHLNDDGLPKATVVFGDECISCHSCENNCARGAIKIVEIVLEDS
ncbi:4Fe-4S dicluster domain-containing protein [Entamoeba marina]